MNYLKPEMDILVITEDDIVRTSNLEVKDNAEMNNITSGTGGL